jgi:hypothetical protein
MGKILTIARIQISQFHATPDRNQTLPLTFRKEADRVTFTIPATKVHMMVMVAQ